MFRHILIPTDGSPLARKGIRAGVRLAIRNEKMPLTPDKIRKGLESITNFDANGMIAPVTVTAKDHGGGGKTRIEMWDGTKWVPQTDWISGYADIVGEVVNLHRELAWYESPK